MLRLTIGPVDKIGNGDSSPFPPQTADVLAGA
jgi:hypothetical protein